ncbi:MAG TPA: hypothetical protein VLE70_06390 [Anaerolineae bacterium]|jgi:hypothetical protein|nr:hypothetical protein [Anaerolineae bacterium]
MKLSVSVRTVIIWLFASVLVANAIGVVSRMVENLLGYEGTSKIVRLFHVGQEGNITTWFSSMLLSMSAVLLALIAAGKRARREPYIKHWTGLAVIFIYLSLDEAAKIHELTIDPLREALNLTGALYYAWVIVAIPLLLLLAVLYLHFLLDLPGMTRLLFVAAGAIYVFGGMGMDMVGGIVLTSDLERSLALADLLIIIEEFLENVGVALFITALVLYMKQEPDMNELTLKLS